MTNTLSCDRNMVNAILRKQKNTVYKQFFCNNNCTDMVVKIKKLYDHKKYNTIPDDIFYINNIFNKCERINAFNTYFSSISNDLQEYYLPMVNNENRSTHERYLKNLQKHTFYLSTYICYFFYCYWGL